MSEHTQSPGLPRPLLSTPEMIAACAARDFAAVFALARARGGFHSSRIARHCDLTPSRVGEVIAGQRRITNMSVVERIADGLRIPGQMVGLARRPWEAVDLPPAGPTESAFTRLPAANHDGAVPSADLDEILEVAAGAECTPVTLRALQASIEHYWRHDDEHGGAALRPAVLGQLRYVLAIMRDAGDANYRHGLCGIAAELSRLAGWTHFDARHFSTARRYFTEAIRLARQIDDQQFIANVLACMSLQATYEDRAGDAVALAHAAQDRARIAGAPPRVHAMLAIREAFGHAASKSAEETRRAIRDAHAHFECADSAEDPAWISYFDRTKLTVDTGIALAQLGDSTAAEHLIADSLGQEQPANARGRAFHFFWLARTRLDRGELDSSCQAAHQTLDLMTSVASARVLAHVRDLRNTLHQRTDSHQVAELADRMHALGL